MYPHERSLVKRLEGKEFALIGVNSDTDRAQVQRAVKDENITWRSFWNGGGTEGPISQAWGVYSWPSIWVIDHKGIIRYRDLGGRSLDAAIDKLIQEMEAGG